MLKNTLSFQPDSRGKWTPNYDGACAMAPAVEKYFVKIYKKINQKNQSKGKQLDKSQTWKGGLGKNERLGGLKTRKGGPGKN